MKETLQLNTQEQKRIMILNRLMAGELKTQEAAQLVGRSPRQVQRWLAAYRARGVEAVVHGNRGRAPTHRTDEQRRAQVLACAQGRYAGCNWQHFRDLLEEREGIVLSRSTVRRIVLAAGGKAARHYRPPRHRSRRERFPQEGMLVQIDGSPHAWLEERGPRLCLLSGIDDATGKIVAALFCEQEDTQGYMQLLQQIVERDGCPQAVYHDQHTLFPPRQHQAREQDDIEDQLRGHRQLGQLGRLLHTLGIQSIAARSPQAKGRVERLFGTLQDRLVIELRLAGASTMQEANALLQEYLPRFNARFQVPARVEEPAYQPIPAGVQLDEAFCFVHERVVANDNTIGFRGERLHVQATAERKSFVRARVQVHQHFDGSLKVWYQGRCLVTTPAPLEAPRLRVRGDAPRSRVAGSLAPVQSQASPPQAARVRGSTHPPRADHPWTKRAVRPKTTDSLTS